MGALAGRYLGVGMSDVPPTRPVTTPAGAQHCADCGALLAHDQRYCVRCGARRGPLHTRVAVALGELADRGRPAPLAAVDPPPADAEEPDRARDLIPLARAAAVSILLMLGVGSVIGAATTPGGVTSLARTVVVAFSPAAAPPATTVVASTGTGAGGGAGHATAGGSGGGGGGGAPTPAPAPPPATQTARTVTVPDTGSGGGRTSSTTSPPAASPTVPATLPPIGHVWEIVLSDQGYSQSFGTTTGHPYLSRTLAEQGEVISNYDAVAASPLANEIALVSGQGPTPDTLQDCPQYSDLTPATSGRLGQVLGNGCLYPSTTQTLGLQMQIDGLQWRAYVEGIGDPGQTHPTTTSTTTTSTPPSTPTTTTSTTAAGATTPSTPATSTVTTPGSTSTTTTSSTTPTQTEQTTPSTSSTTTSVSTSGSELPVVDTSTAAGCPHPASSATDTSQTASVNDGYVTWKNPWMYFHSVVDSSSCATQDVGLDQLSSDLTSESTTPAFSYIAPSPCDDGSDTPCYPGAKAGLGQADTFLKSVVPEIERSPAYKDNGLILITFDEAPQSGPDWSTVSCCGQPTFPNVKATSTPGTSSSTTDTTDTTSTTTATSTPTPTSTTTTTSVGATTPLPTTTTTTATTPGTTPTTSGTTSTTTCPATTTPPTPTSTTSTASTTTTTGEYCQPALTGDPPGGGQVGLLMISPYVQPGKQDTIDVYNHFSLLASIEDLFGLSPLGYAADPQVPTFTPSLFQAAKQ